MHRTPSAPVMPTLAIMFTKSVIWARLVTVGMAIAGIIGYFWINYYGVELISKASEIDQNGSHRVWAIMKIAHWGNTFFTPTGIIIIASICLGLYPISKNEWAQDINAEYVPPKRENLMAVFIMGVGIAIACGPSMVWGYPLFSDIINDPNWSNK